MIIWTLSEQQFQNSQLLLRQCVCEKELNVFACYYCFHYIIRSMLFYRVACASVYASILHGYVLVTRAVFQVYVGCTLHVHT